MPQTVIFLGILAVLFLLVARWLSDRNQTSRLIRVGELGRLVLKDAVLSIRIFVIGSELVELGYYFRCPDSGRELLEEDAPDFRVKTNQSGHFEFLINIAPYVVVGHIENQEHVWVSLVHEPEASVKTKEGEQCQTHA